MITNKIYKTEGINWRQVKDLQPDNLKVHYNIAALRSSIMKHGIAKAYDVCELDGELYWLDGHTRTEMLRTLESEGIAIPDTVTANFCEVKDRKEAIQILLDVHNQRQNPISEVVLEEWLEFEEVPVEDVAMDSLLTKEEDEEEKHIEAKEDDFNEPLPTVPKTVLGDLYEIGEHRLLCGDSTDSDQVSKLMNGEKADMAHNDPPYGMKKEKDGVLNDNLNSDDLLSFNCIWIDLQFTILKDNASWYCWGIDEPLMDIYSNILKPYIKDGKATFRNLITWDKGNGQGQMSDGFRMYPIADEKC